MSTGRRVAIGLPCLIGWTYLWGYLGHLHAMWWDEIGVRNAPWWDAPTMVLSIALAVGGAAATIVFMIGAFPSGRDVR